MSPLAPPPTYTWIDFGTCKQQLANRLYDSGMVFWADAELGLYLREALRTWNALTSYWRGDFTFPSIADNTWYDITNAALFPNTLRPYTILDTDVYRDIQYSLLEPATGVNPWTGASLQFSANDLIEAVQRRRDELLSITGCTQTVLTVPAVAGRILLPDNILDVRRVAYLPAVGSPNVVWPEDTWAEQSYCRDYTILPAGTPSTYLMSTQPPIAFDVDRPPAFGGSYEILVVEAGPLLSPATSQTFPIPDDWIHIIKWGALADLLSRDSNARDTQRADYCEQRYRLGAKMLIEAPALLALRIGNVPFQIDSVREGDLYFTEWEAQESAQPNEAFYAGLNLVGLSPSPDIGGSLYGIGLYGAGLYGATPFYSLTATVVRNAPVPVLDGDPVQVARDDLDCIIDYAQHIASFKMGGAEFAATMPLLQRFLKQASIYGLKLDELGEYTKPLYALASREQRMNPRLAPVAPGTPAPVGALDG